MSEALKYGISRYMLYSLLRMGIIERVSRGIYRLADLPALSNPDLVTIALRFPRAVICLVSALSFHDLTSQISHAISVAVSRKSRMPSLDHPPLRVYRFSKDAFRIGIEEHLIDNVPVKVYSPEKTLVDCFKFRNKIGLDITLEALKLYRKNREFRAKEILHFARICRVERIMRPYLEASL